MDKEIFLKKYHKDVMVVENDIETISDIPQAWKEFLCAGSAEEKITKVLLWWKTFAHPILSNTIMYLERNLIDVELIRYSGKYSLLYSIKTINNAVLYYEGGNPKKGKKPLKIQKHWERFPVEIRKFYENLHDGFFYYASGSMGILPVEDIVVFGDEDWAILDDLKEPLKINMDNTYGLFSSGIGGYVAVDLSNSSGAVLWFTNRQPKYGINFWDVVDEWIVIGFQV